MNSSEHLEIPSPPPTRPRWRRRLFLGAGMLLVLAIASLIGLYYYLAHVDDRELQQTVADLDQREPNGWRLEEIEARRAVIPYDENSAQVVLDAKKLMPKIWPSISPRPTPAPDVVGPEPEPPDMPVFPPVEVPPLDTRISLLPRNLLLDEATVQELRRELDLVFPALALAHRLADLPKGRYTVVYTPDYISTLLPVQDARSVGQMLAMESVLWSMDGHPDNALRSCRGTFNAGRSVGDEPGLISMLVRVSLVANAVNHVERTLALGQPSEKELEAMQRLLEDEATQPLLHNGFRGERAGIHRLLGELTKGNLSLSQIGGVAGKPNLVDNLGDAFGKLRIKHSHALILRMETEWVEASKLPVEQQGDRFRQIEPEVVKTARSDLIASLLLPATIKISEAFQLHQARLRCAQVALAVERYRRVHGYWPASLKVLEGSKFLDVVPNDVWAVQEPNRVVEQASVAISSLRYRRTAEGVVIYSIGSDRQDNGGKITNNPRDAGTDIGFRLWNLDRRRGPAHEWIPQPTRTAEGN